jgi:osmotically-inducible protein OsmY
MKLKLMAAAMMAAGLVMSGCASNRDDTSSAGSSRTAGEFTSDAALTAKVKTALANDAGLGTAADVNVNTYRGVASSTRRTRSSARPTPRAASRA